MPDPDRPHPENSPLVLDYATPPKPEFKPLPQIIKTAALCHFCLLLAAAIAAGNDVPFCSYVAGCLAFPAILWLITGFFDIAAESGDTFGPVFLSLVLIMFNSLLWGTGWAAIVTRRDVSRRHDEWAELLWRRRPFLKLAVATSLLHSFVTMGMVSLIFRHLGRGGGFGYHLRPAASPVAIIVLYVWEIPAALLAKRWGTVVSLPGGMWTLLANSILWGAILTLIGRSLFRRWTTRITR